MIGQVQTINGQKQIIPMTGGVPDGSVGSLIMKYKKIQPKNCLYCDGRDTTGTDEELSIYYPALYMYLGSNVLPDYRECTFVGAEQNTTDTIATHDVYTQGQFKDDQLQDHRHSVYISGQGNGLAFGGSESLRTDNRVMGVIDGRSGTTTHGKQKAVYVYIVAIDSVVVSDDESFLRVVENYIDEKNSYSTTEQLTGGTWIDDKPIYRKVIQGTLTGSEQAVNHNISNLGTVIRQYGFLSGNNFTPVGFSFSNYYFSTFTDSSKVNIRASSSYVNETFVIILEYTKTTN